MGVEGGLEQPEGVCNENRVGANHVRIAGAVTQGHDWRLM
jgi:hypothetical protein